MPKLNSPRKPNGPWFWVVGLLLIVPIVVAIVAGFVDLVRSVK